MKFIIKHKYLFITIIVLLISFFIFGLNCFNINVWFDEAYQMVLNRYSFKEILFMVKNDTSPPLYAFLLKIVTSIFGSKVSVGRFLSLFLFDIQIILAFYPIRRLFNSKVSFIYCILILTSFYSFFASIEVRLYSLSMTFTVGAVVYALLYLKDNKISDLIKYIIFGIIGAYGHNYASISIFFIVIMTLIVSLVKRKGRLINIGNLIIFLGYLPWLNIMRNQEKNISKSFWIEKPSIDTIMQIIHHIFTDYNILLIIMIIILILCFIFSNNKKDNIKKYLLLSIPSIGVITFFYIYSVYKTPILVAKYAVPVCGILYLLIAKILGDSKYKILPILFILLLIPGFIYNFKIERKVSDDSSMKKMIKFVNNNSNSKSITFINSDEASLGISEYYFKNSTHYITKHYDFIINTPEMFGKINYYNKIEDINKEDQLILFSTSNNDTFFRYNSEILKNYIFVKEKSFPSLYNEGFSIYIFEKNKDV